MKKTKKRRKINSGEFHKNMQSNEFYSENQNFNQNYNNNSITKNENFNTRSIQYQTEDTSSNYPFTPKKIQKQEKIPDSSFYDNNEISYSQNEIPVDGVYNVDQNNPYLFDESFPGANNNFYSPQQQFNNPNFQKINFKQKKSKIDEPVLGTKFWIFVAIFLVVTILLLVTWNAFAKKIMDWFAGIIRGITDKRPFGVYFTILLSILIVGEVFPIPGLNLLIIMIAFVLQNFVVSYILAVLSHLISASIIYFIVTKCFKSYFVKRFKENILFKLVMEESRRKPVKVTFVIRFIEVQEMLKNTLISLGPTSYFTFIWTDLVYNCFINSLFVYVGQKLTDPSKLLTPKGWGDKTSEEKLSFIITYIALLMSLLIISFICCYTNGKIKRFRKQQHEKEERLQMMMMNQGGYGINQWNGNYNYNNQNQGNLNQGEFYYNDGDFSQNQSGVYDYEGDNNQENYELEQEINFGVEMNELSDPPIESPSPFSQNKHYGAHQTQPRFENQVNSSPFQQQQQQNLENQQINFTSFGGQKMKKKSTSKQLSPFMKSEPLSERNSDQENNEGNTFYRGR